MYSSEFSEVGDGKVSILMKIVCFIYFAFFRVRVLCILFVFDCFGYYSFVFWRIEFSVIQ